jgi:hypothetical protein
MAAITRWVQYDITASGIATGGDKGTRAYSIGTTDPGDVIDIGPTTNRLHVTIDGVAGNYITLCSGLDLDPRFVARDITEKMHNLHPEEEGWQQAICTWENVTITGSYTKRNRFVIRSGTLGSASTVTVASGTLDARGALGFTTKSEAGGVVTPDGKAAYGFDGTVVISGAYYGFFDEVYKIVACNGDDAVNNIGAAGIGGSNTYAGTMNTGGIFNHTSDTQYVIEIDVTNGTTMGGGTGQVPRMRWTSDGSDGQTDWTELLYPDYWYKVGSYGLMVKFTDAVFNTVNPAWTIQCYKPVHVQGSNADAPLGTAQYMWSSDRGDDSVSAVTTVSGGYTALGTRGLYIKFDGTNNLYAGDCYYVICSAPKPSSGDAGITSLNYGNVTVSTESSLKAVMFEVESGAAQVSTVKFGLQNHGTFSHHNAGNSDTYFRFGTVGPYNNGTSPAGVEWWPNLTAADIDNDTPPTYLYATEDNLPVVATADASEAIGSYPLKGMTSDPMWLNIRLGAGETGANSTINYRLYFDYA